jgi:hypothetical protein
MNSPLSLTKGWTILSRSALFVFPDLQTRFDFLRGFRYNCVSMQQEERLPIPLEVDGIDVRGPTNTL